MRIHETEVYNFNELSDDAKETAIEKLRETACQWDDWHEYTLELAKQILQDFGFENPEISYSGFWSQGDGASFTAEYVDAVRLIGILLNPPEPSETISASESGREQFVPYAIQKIGGLPGISARQIDWIFSSDDFRNEFDIKVVRSSFRYCHENTCSVESLGYFPESVETYAKELTEAIEELRRDLCHLIYRMLEDEYNYQTSDEVLRETAIDCELEFTVDGNPF